MSTRSKIGVILVYMLLASCLVGSMGSNLYAQEEEKKEEKKEDEEKKDAKKTLKEILSLKNLLHKNDSTRLTKRYIRWHKKLTRGDEDYRFTISKDELKNLDAFKSTIKVPLKREVFGWYPYWDENLFNHLDYSLLSTVAYFSYKVDPRNGKPDTTEINTLKQWNEPGLIEKIKAVNDSNKTKKKVLLTVSLFGNDEVKRFLKNTSAGDTLIDNVIKLLDDRGGNGVCIDFEGVIKSQRNRYNSFIADFSQRLKSHNKDYQVYLTIPAVDWNESIQYDLLIPLVDRFVIMGYNYYGRTSKEAGPVAPLKSAEPWMPLNLTYSVDTLLNTEVPKAKLILALPFYGSIWETKSGEKGSKVTKFVGSRTVDYLKSEMDKEPTIKRQYDSVSHSSWYSFVVKDTMRNKRRFRQIWVDSDSAFAEKLNLINERDLAGVGIWALGYNKHYDNYWKEIERSFRNSEGSFDDHPINLENLDSLIVIYTNDSIQMAHSTRKAMKMKEKEEAKAAGASFLDKLKGINDKLKDISGMSDLLIFALGFVVLFGGIGFVISMFKPETRMFFFNSKAYTIYFTVILSVFLMVLMRKLDAIRDPSVVLLFGFVLGAIIVYLVSKYVQKAKRNLP